MNNSKSVPANCIDGVSNEPNIAEHWRSYHEHISLTVFDIFQTKTIFYLTLICVVGTRIVNCCADEVYQIICNLKRVKASGPDK